MGHLNLFVGCIIKDMEINANNPYGCLSCAHAFVNHKTLVGCNLDVYSLERWFTNDGYEVCKEYTPIVQLSDTPFKVNNTNVSLSEGKVIDDIDPEEKIIIKIDYTK